MKKPKLIVVEGFDRIGKDTFLRRLKAHYQIINDHTKFVYIQQIPNDMPHYRTDPEEFKKFLVDYTRDEINSIVEAVNNGATTVFMTRLFVSDAVYSSLFNRENVVDQFLDQVLEVFEVENAYLTFDGYDQYLKRLELINDKEVEYTKEEFDKIDKLYMQMLFKYLLEHDMTFKLKHYKAEDIIQIEDVIDEEVKTHGIVQSLQARFS